MQLLSASANKRSQQSELVRPPDLLEELLSQLIRTIGLHQPVTIAAGTTLSLSEALALAELAGQSPLSQRELADRLRLEKSSVSRMAAGLERRGWLVRERDPGNRRSYRIALTAQGRGIVEHWRRHWQGRHHRILAALTPEELRAVREGFAALERAVSAVD
jgi:DNA-binding MarR family transcriptional regulator